MDVSVEIDECLLAAIDQAADVQKISSSLSEWALAERTRKLN
jgi:hypothetical protein